MVLLLRCILAEITMIVLNIRYLVRSNLGQLHRFLQNLRYLETLSLTDGSALCNFDFVTLLDILTSSVSKEFLGDSEPLLVEWMEYRTVNCHRYSVLHLCRGDDSDLRAHG